MIVICIYIYNAYSTYEYITDIHPWILFNHQLRRSDTGGTGFFQVFRPQLRDSDMIPKLCEAWGGFEVWWVEPEVVGSLNAPINESIITAIKFIKFWLIILLHHFLQ